MVRVSGNSFLNEALECVCLNHAVFDEFLEPSLQVVLMYA